MSYRIIAIENECCNGPQLGHTLVLMYKVPIFFQVRDYRSEWKIEVNQPIAGNYYPVSSLFTLFYMLYGEV
jgi:hypothetical protein